MSNLSYWEKSIYFNELDVAIIGAGIVGICTGISLLERDPDLRILILERNYLPSGASTKNAGFACFGSPSELLDDLRLHDPDKVFSLFKKRYDGIQKLLKYTGSSSIDLTTDGGYELLHSNYSQIVFGDEELTVLNNQIKQYTGLQNYFYLDHSKLETFGLTGFDQIITNNHECGLHPVKMLESLSKIFTNKHGKILYGARLTEWNDQERYVNLKLEDETQLRVKKLIFCVNGFAHQLLPELNVEAARNMVMVLKPHQALQIKGCFHLDRGYFYFRNIHGNLLIGGGRHLDPDTETTLEFGCNEKIKTALLELVKSNILKDKEFTILDQWSGILGLGPEKRPIIEMVSKNIAAAVRLGGMGIAIGSLVGEKAAEMIFQNLQKES